MRRLSAVLVLLLAFSCAKMVAPGGGPEDDTPPEMLAADPPPGTGYEGLQHISILWSERLSESTVSVFLYPPVDHELDVSGSGIDVRLAVPLEGGPLVIHLPREIRDRRNNRLDSSIDLVYTAEDSLPTGSVQVGMVRQGGGSLSSLSLVELYLDSVLVRRTAPDTAGTASLNWLKPGTYRLLCFEDPDRSFTWDPESEAGIDTSIELVSGDTLRLETTLTVVDTVGPILTDVSSVDSYHLQLQFNEEVSYRSFGKGEVSLADSLGESIPIRGYWLSGGATSSMVVLETVESPDSRLSLFLSGIEDLMGNPSRPDSMEFFGVDSIPADSLRIRSYYPAPGSDNAEPGGPYRISFNYYVDPDLLSRNLILERVVDTTAVEGSLTVVDGRSFEYYPLHQLIGEQQYRFILRPGLGTLWGDTLSIPFSWSFSPVWGDEPGSISGEIAGYGGQDILLQIRRTGGDTDARVTYAQVGRGEYSVDEIPAGRYTVAAFVDSDDSGTWTGAEPYGTYPGVVLVQPGLITRDVDIEILP